MIALSWGVPSEKIVQQPESFAKPVSGLAKGCR